MLVFMKKKNYIFCIHEAYIFAHMAVKVWGGDKGLSGHVRKESKFFLDGSPNAQFITPY